MALRAALDSAMTDVAKYPFPVDISMSSGESSTLLGFAILTSWSISDGIPADGRTRLMMSLLHHKYRKSKGINFLEHHVLHCAFIDKPVTDMQITAVADADCIANVQGAKFAVGEPRASGRALVHTFPRLRDCWVRQFACSSTVYVWPFWWPLAQLVLTGHWPIDVTPIVPRMTHRIWMPPVLPPRAQLRRIRNSRALRQIDCHATPHSRRTVKLGTPCSSGEPLRMRPYGPEHHIRAVVAGQHLKAQSLAGQRAKSHLALMFPDRPDLQDMLDASGFDVPKKTSLCGSRSRFDVAAMIAHRELYRRTGPFFRYIASDASPQHSESIELFSSVERVVCREAIKGKSMADVKAQDARQRYLPLSTLGQGKTDLASKVIAQATQYGSKCTVEAQHK